MTPPGPPDAPPAGDDAPLGELVPWAPVAATPVVATDGPPPPWADLVEALAAVDVWTLATVDGDGAPHAVPVLGTWVAGGLCVSAGPRTRKGRNLARDRRVALTGATDRWHLVVEGHATPVHGAGALHQVAGAYLAAHGWAPEVRDGQLWAEGAPTAGPPPYAVHRVEPRVAFAFSAGGDVPAGRWRF